jgi:hypothetical protein
MLLIQDNVVIGNTAPNIYADMKPWTHDSGAAWWVVDNETGIDFIDSDGQVYKLRKRSLSELQATPEYQEWIGNHPEEQRRLSNKRKQMNNKFILNKKSSDVKKNGCGKNMNDYALKKSEITSCKN